MTFRDFEAPSPNFSGSPAHERLGVCFHHTVMPFAATLAYMQDPAKAVSYHCVIDLDGTRATLVADVHVAWHAGVSSFHGRSRCNEFLLGLSFAGDTYVTPLTDAQLASALEWLSLRWRPLGWTTAWMTDHRQIAPERKNDLNPAEWRRLHAAIAERFEPAKGG